MIANELGGHGQEDLANINSDELGFVVLTQTCDIIRSSKDRPFVEVCRIIEVDDTELHQIKAERRPRYAYLPALAEKRLVADFDRTSLVEKAVLERRTAERVATCNTPEQQRAFAAALARKYTRVAFPEKFVAAVAKIQDRIRKNVNNSTPEGQFLRALREVRVRCEPGWDAPEPELTFYLMFDLANVPQDNVHQSKALMDRFVDVAPFAKPKHSAVCYEMMSVANYHSTDPLDLDSVLKP